MPKPIKIITKKTLGSRPSRKLSPRRPKLLLTLRPGFKICIFAVLVAIDPPLKQTNIPKEIVQPEFFQVSRA